LREGEFNPCMAVAFTDFDDPAQGNTLPFRVQVVSPPEFFLREPPLSTSGNYTLCYRGTLNRTTTKSLTVTFNATDSRGFSQVTAIPVIVADVESNSPISNGLKTINVVYVNGYGNSLINVPLGSVFVNDADEWFRANRVYTVRDRQTFSAAQGLLSTSTPLNPGSTTVLVDVTKPIAASSAVGTVDINVANVDSEFVRQAATIRISGDTPQTLLDPTLGNRLNAFRNALAEFLLVTPASIVVLAIRAVNQYRHPIFAPLPLDQARQQAQTDVVFYVPGQNRYEIENTLNSRLGQFASRYGVTAVASGPNPCTDYRCPTGKRRND
jgi:hypothetical protein